MTEQLAMTGTEAYQVATGRTLTPRQQQVFDHVRAHDGVTADQIGALLHSQRGKRQHPADQRCTWCARDGHAALSSKGLKQLVKYRNEHGARVYVVRDPKDRVRAPEPTYEPTEEELQANPFAGL
jgi:hypothetical protein